MKTSLRKLRTWNHSSCNLSGNAVDFLVVLKIMFILFLHSPVTEIYWELMRLRSQMALARLGMETTVTVQRSSGHS